MGSIPLCYIEAVWLKPRCIASCCKLIGIVAVKPCREQWVSQLVQVRCGIRLEREGPGAGCCYWRETSWLRATLLCLASLYSPPSLPLGCLLLWLWSAGIISMDFSSLILICLLSILGTLIPSQTVLQEFPPLWLAENNRKLCGEL